MTFFLWIEVKVFWVKVIKKGLIHPELVSGSQEMLK